MSPRRLHAKVQAVPAPLPRKGRKQECPERPWRRNYPAHNPMSPSLSAVNAGLSPHGLDYIRLSHKCTDFAVVQTAANSGARARIAIPESAVFTTRTFIDLHLLIQDMTRLTCERHSEQSSCQTFCNSHGAFRPGMQYRYKK